MSGTDSSSNEPYDALERLYDEPEQRVSELESSQSSDFSGQEAVFKALGNRDRLRILEILRGSEACGCELQVVLDAPQSTVATHLRKLKEVGLVKSRKKGKWSYYRIADTAVIELLDLSQSVQEDV